MRSLSSSNGRLTARYGSSSRPHAPLKSQIPSPPQVPVRPHTRTNPEPRPEPGTRPEVAFHRGRSMTASVHARDTKGPCRVDGPPGSAPNDSPATARKARASHHAPRRSPAFLPVAVSCSPGWSIHGCGRAPPRRRWPPGPGPCAIRTTSCSTRDGDAESWPAARIHWSSAGPWRSSRTPSRRVMREHGDATSPPSTICGETPPPWPVVRSSRAEGVALHHTRRG